ncbi:tRNA-dependent cyclodipeptide synthase [Seonamhaeicola sp. MEBiC1930]|uniref:tRNA-dependent cyclodipeptide synthase n=1 Tax=Seonamhaeicola sp. MEBiC01930 TaxID=2976768 RepID=UPI00324F6D02
MEHRYYKIKAKPAASQTGAKVCSLNISMNNDNQTGDKLKAMIEWVNANFDHCIVNVSDSLQRHNLISQGFSKDVAYKKAIALGDEWLATNDNILKQLTIPYEISRWDNWLGLTRVQKLQENLYKMYKTVKPFQACVNLDAQQWVARQLGTNDNQQVLQNGVAFLLEEFAVHSHIAEREWQKGNGKMVQAYPAKQLQSEDFLRNRFGRMGLEKSYFVRQKVETRTVSNTN